MAQRRKITLSFSGCGFLGIYHVGVASCFRDFEQHFEVTCIAGASAGAMAAVSYLCDVNLGTATSDVLKIAASARASPVGPLSPRFNIVKIIRDGLNRVLPDNAHEICSGRLSVSLTRCHDGQNLMVNSFASKEELIQVLICSSFVPFYSGIIPPYYKDARYWDGGMTNNLPIFDDKTITVSPFSGESDICPSDSSCAFLDISFANHNIRLNSHNMYRLSRALFPPHPLILSDMCKAGYVDAMRFIKKLIMCDAGVPLNPSLSVPRSESEERPETSSLVAIVEVCETVEPVEPVTLADDPIRQLLEKIGPNNCNLPVLVVKALREACDSVPHPALQVLSFVAIPWILPLEIMYSTCTRVIALLPLIPRAKTTELQYYVEVFSWIAQSVGTKLLKRHSGKWLKCSCGSESVHLSMSGSARCIMHGAGEIHRSHSFAFAFKMSIEESVSSPSALPSPPSAFPVLEIGPKRMRTGTNTMLPVLQEAGMECYDIHGADLAMFTELCAQVEQHDDAIADYFRLLMLNAQPRSESGFGLVPSTVVITEISDLEGASV